MEILRLYGELFVYRTVKLEKTKLYQKNVKYYGGRMKMETLMHYFTHV